MPEQEIDTKEILSKLKYSVLILVLTVAGVIAAIVMKIYPTYMTIDALNKSYTSQTQVLAEKQTELQDLQAAVKKQEDMSGIEKEVFESSDTGLDAEGVIASEFSEILEIIRANTIKTRSINYEYDPKDDKFVQGAGDKFNVARLSMEMIATYKNFENFLKELYKHEHFLDISKIEVEPYEKDKSILLINFELTLYAKK